MQTTTIETPSGTAEVSFERRNYGGGQFYCWAFLHIGEEAHSLGDPWPATNWKRTELVKAIEHKRAELAGTCADCAKTCKDCGKQIEYLADFPGPRCLTCHAKKVENEPLERPDFKRAVRV